jgi:hypothetical protein
MVGGVRVAEAHGNSKFTTSNGEVLWAVISQKI